MMTNEASHVGIYPNAPLTQVQHALESSRNSGFDLSAAVGELVDNSYQAGARNIRIATTRDPSGSIVGASVAVTTTPPAPVSTMPSR